MGSEGVQGAIGKPPGLARMRETLGVCKDAYMTCKNDEAEFLANT